MNLGVTFRIESYIGLTKESVLLQVFVLSPRSKDSNNLSVHFVPTTFSQTNHIKRKNLKFIKKLTVDTNTM